MNSRTILAALVGTIVSFLMGWLVYGLLLMDYFEKNVKTYDGIMKEESEAMIGYVLGSIIQGILACYILDTANVRSFGRGAIIGGVVWAMIEAIHSVYFYFGMEWYTSTSPVIVAVISNAVVGIVIGGAVGWMLGRGTKAAA